MYIPARWFVLSSVLFLATLTISYAAIASVPSNTATITVDAPSSQAGTAEISTTTPLTVMLNALPIGLDPEAAGDHDAAYMLGLLYEAPLLIGPDGTYLAGLAEAVTIAPNSSVYTFTLRPGVVFHDGTPFTAESVVDAWERGVRLGQENWLAADSVTVVGPLEARVELLNAPDRFLDAVAPTWAIARETIGENGQPQLVGTGPFMSKRLTDERFVLDPYIEYWRDLNPEIGSIVLESAATKKEMLAALLDGKVGLAFGFSAEDLAGVEGFDWLNRSSEDDQGLKVIIPQALVPGEVRLSSATWLTGVTSATDVSTTVELLQQGFDWNELKAQQALAALDSMQTTGAPSALAALEDAIGSNVLLQSDVTASWNPQAFTPNTDGVGNAFDPDAFDPFGAAEALADLGLDQGAGVVLSCSTELPGMAAACAQALKDMKALGVNVSMPPPEESTPTLPYDGGSNTLMRVPLAVDGTLVALTSHSAVDNPLQWLLAQGLGLGNCEDCSRAQPEPLPYPIPPFPLPPGPRSTTSLSAFAPGGSSGVVVQDLVSKPPQPLRVVRQGR